MGGNAFSVTNFSLSYQGKLQNSIKGRNDGLVHPGVNQKIDANGNITYEKNTTVTDDILSYYNNVIWSRDNTESNTFSTSYLKLREVRLDYELTPKTLKSLKVLQSASVGVYATNLFVWTNFPQYDPDTGMLSGTNIYRGIESMTYPLTRTYGLNIKLAF